MPTDIDTYVKSESLNLTNKTSTKSPITAYANASATDGLYDVIIYSPGKIYPGSCSSMFQSWKKLTNITFDNFYTKNVTIMYKMFNYCNGLTSLDVSNFDTSSVTDMGYMFSWCSNLKKIYVTQYNTSTGKGWNIDNVTSSSSMFSNCINLVGGAGITYNISYADKTYARIDTANTLGYLTDIADKVS